MTRTRGAAVGRATGPARTRAPGRPDSGPAPPDKVAAAGIRVSSSTALDGFFFVFAGLAALWLAVLLLTENFVWGWGTIWFAVVFWLLLAYLVLPRLHRILTYIYVPDYFIGRARTSDGLLGDPVNLAVNGPERQLHAVMTAAGWIRADDVTLRSGVNIVRATLTRRSYARAPVSPLLLFGRVQDFAYQQEVADNPAKRHHVRFWRCPDGWLLPGGHGVDWLAAGTFDRSVGFSLFTFQITHKIDANTDIERDHIVATVRAGSPETRVELIRDFSTGYHSRNGGGDSIETDGDLPVLSLPGARRRRAGRSRTGRSRVDQRRAGRRRAGRHPADPGGVGRRRGGEQSRRSRRGPRPPAIIGGALLILTRVAAGVFTIVTLRPQSLTVDTGPDPRAAEAVLIVFLSGYGAVLQVQLLCVWLVLRGTNWARVLAMVTATLSIGASFLDYWNDGAPITLATSLPAVTVDILILLALSSTAARRYARPDSAWTDVGGTT
ncbi:hypothetical protein D6T64_12535 [Cryobacterium melibiosiphilum]|uniref:LssY-like C-terminal domain-containing protein n=1 Tax=Cryobacterium melibiosiphilum TaxID=995039 RepID=A0A3A5MCQ8_9MICO|nr:LssY C-terminal domain-containing protein [Cryobacterium melibiosiphilum]RJT87920.1 hypothetical protein D6T64_12535 [Cryobacterium melibiosiphilum]